MRGRFDRAYATRKAAGHTIQLGRGLWLPLSIPQSTSTPAHVGAGAGFVNPPIAKVPLNPREGTEIIPQKPPSDEADQSLSIQEAKRRLAVSLGVDPGSIKITVEASSARL